MNGKRYILTFTLLVFLLGAESTEGTDFLSAWDYGYQLSINLTGARIANHTLQPVTLNISILNGTNVPALAVAFNNSGTWEEVPWEWFHQRNDTVKVNDTIRFRVNVFNNSLQTNYWIFTTDNSSMPPRSISLFLFYDGFEVGNVNGWVNETGVHFEATDRRSANGRWCGNKSDATTYKEAYYDFPFNLDDKANITICWFARWETNRSINLPYLLQNLSGAYADKARDNVLETWFFNEGKPTVLKDGRPSPTQTVRMYDNNSIYVLGNFLFRTWYAWCYKDIDTRGADINSDFWADGKLNYSNVTGWRYRSVAAHMVLNHSNIKDYYSSVATIDVIGTIVQVLGNILFGTWTWCYKDIGTRGDDIDSDFLFTKKLTYSAAAVDTIDGISLANSANLENHLSEAYIDEVYVSVGYDYNIYETVPEIGIGAQEVSGMVDNPTTTSTTTSTSTTTTVEYIKGDDFSSAWDYKHQLSIDLTGAKIANHTLQPVTLNVSTLSGTNVPALRVAFNNSGTWEEVPWEWFHQRGDTVKVKDTIRFRVNVFNNTLQRNYWVFTTDNDLMPPRSVSLFLLYDGFEVGNVDGWVNETGVHFEASDRRSANGEWCGNKSDNTTYYEAYYDFPFNLDDKANITICWFARWETNRSINLPYLLQNLSGAYTDKPRDNVLETWFFNEKKPGVPQTIRMYNDDAVKVLGKFLFGTWYAWCYKDIDTRGADIDSDFWINSELNRSDVSGWRDHGVLAIDTIDGISLANSANLENHLSEAYIDEVYVSVGYDYNIYEAVPEIRIIELYSSNQRDI